jgi:hypothetical protein
MKTKTRVRAGGVMFNHNETLVKAAPMGLKVKTKVKAGALTTNHNETLVQEPRDKGSR